MAKIKNKGGKIHSSLQALLPRIKVHGCEFGEGSLSHKYIEALALIDERSAIRSHVNKRPLFDFPNSLVDLLQFVRNLFYILYGSLVFCGVSV